MYRICRVWCQIELPFVNLFRVPGSFFLLRWTLMVSLVQQLSSPHWIVSLVLWESSNRSATRHLLGLPYSVTGFADTSPPSSSFPLLPPPSLSPPECTAGERVGPHRSVQRCTILTPVFVYGRSCVGGEQGDTQGDTLSFEDRCVSSLFGKRRNF